jgi:hypothetical protein
MHPISVLIAAAVGLLVYSNFVFFTRPPVPKHHNFEVVMPGDAEKQRIKNLPFYIVGRPLPARHAFAGRQDRMESEKLHTIKGEPRSQRYIINQSSGTRALPVKIQLGNRFTTMAQLPPGYSLFLPPTWKAQIEVPKDTECMLYSSDSLGSLCMRMPELASPITSKVGALAHPYLAVCFSTLDTLISQLLSLLQRVEGPFATPNKSVSFPRVLPSSHSLHHMARLRSARSRQAVDQPRDTVKGRKAGLVETSTTQCPVE